MVSACTQTRGLHAPPCLQAAKRCRMLMEACVTAAPVRWRTLERSKRSASSQSRLISSDPFGSLTVWLPGAEGLLQRLPGYTWVLPVVALATCASCSVDKSTAALRKRAAKRKLCRSGAKHCRLNFVKYFCYRDLGFTDILKSVFVFSLTYTMIRCPTLCLS